MLQVASENDISLRGACGGENGKCHLLLATTECSASVPKKFSDAQ